MIFRSLLIFIICLGFQSCKNKSNERSGVAQSNTLIDAEGFKIIFDGKTFNNWKGDFSYWKIEEGNLVGELTPETNLKINTFLIWQGGQPSNFELKLEYRVSDKGNSGINYRSTLIPKSNFALRGYQADIDGKNRYTGQNYEERKRATLAYRGEKVNINTRKLSEGSTSLISNIKKNCWQSRDVVKSLGTPDELISKIKKDDWNELHLVINDNRLQHYVNGILMSDVTDNDSINRSMSGYIGIQGHTGPPMKSEFKNIRIKELQ